MDKQKPKGSAVQIALLTSDVAYFSRALAALKDSLDVEAEITSQIIGATYTEAASFTGQHTSQNGG